MSVDQLFKFRFTCESCGRTEDRWLAEKPTFETMLQSYFEQRAVWLAPWALISNPYTLLCPECNE